PHRSVGAPLRSGGGELSSLALVGDGLSGGLRGDRVEVAAALLDRLEVLVELVDERLAGGDVQARDVLVGDAVEVLHQRAQRVAVGGDEHGLAGGEVGLDALLPVRQEALDDVLEALGLGQLVTEARVLRVLVLRERGAELDRRLRGVVGAAPGHQLLLAVLLADLALVQTLQGAVVTLVEAPVALDGDPVTVRGVQGQVRGHDRAALEGGVDHIREDAGLLHQLTAGGRLLTALVREVDVHPAGEQVLRIPFALAVAEQHECVGHALSLRGSARPGILRPSVTPSRAARQSPPARRGYGPAMTTVASLDLTSLPVVLLDLDGTVVESAPG